MSKIARNPIPVPSGVTLAIDGQMIKAKGPKGELTAIAHSEIAVSLADAEDGKGKIVKIGMKTPSREAKTQWGTVWSLIRNTIKGVSEGYTKNLEITGVGYRANVQGKTLVLQLGYSHDINYAIPDGITVAVDKQTRLAITGIDKQVVGQVAAEIRSYRPPEPYKGKGVKVEGEFILRKEGKKK